jgi:uncharacterized protein (TIGR02646 family)
MRSINKGEAPKTLLETIQTPGANTWESVGDKASLRYALCVEQWGLCAYCLSRLGGFGEKTKDEEHCEIKPGDVKVEHWEPRNEEGIPEEEKQRRRFDWKNLLGACPGGLKVKQKKGEEGEFVEPRIPLSPAQYHCDTFRGTKPLFLNPAVEKNLHRLFQYNREGRISCRDEAFAKEVNNDIQNLNLNVTHLMKARKRVRTEVMNRFKKELSRKKHSEVSILRKLYKQFLSPNAKGQLEAHCEVALLYLEKKLRRYGDDKWLGEQKRP